MGGRSRGERAASERARREMLDRMRAIREARLLRVEVSSLKSDHQIVDFSWVSQPLVPARFDSIEDVERFLNG